jgi:hypothetical protein
MNNQTTRLSNRALRELQAKQLRSDAVNRFMDAQNERVLEMTAQLNVAKGFIALVIVSVFSAAMGWK